MNFSQHDFTVYAMKPRLPTTPLLSLPVIDGFYLAFPRKPCLCDHLIKHWSSIGRIEGGFKINSSLFQTHRINLYNMYAYREKVIWTKVCKNHPSSQRCILECKWNNLIRNAVTVKENRSAHTSFLGYTNFSQHQSGPSCLKHV